MEFILFRASIFLVLCYLLYLFLVRRETNFMINRLYLITGILIAIVLPFIPKISLVAASSEIVNLIEGINFADISESAYRKNTSDLINPMMIIYISGVTWFTFRFLSGLGRIFYLYRRFPHSTIDGLKMVKLEEDQTPFTFFNILFISKADTGLNKDKSILQHEMAHIRLLHSIDVVIAELTCIVFWFNPFIWLIKSALKAEHEFAADDWVMREGYNKLNYQRLLFERTMGASAISLANNFNYSLLKKRILMMTKYKPGRKNHWKYYLAFPLLVLFLACSLSNTDNAQEKDDTIYDKAELMPEFPGGMIEVRKYIAQNLTYPDIAKEQGVEAKIYVQFVVGEDGSVQDAVLMRTDVNEKEENEIVVVAYTPEMVKSSDKKDAILALEEEALRVVKSIPDFKPGMNEGKAVKVRFTFPIFFILQ